MLRKRLLVCEELSKTHTLDMAFIKDITSGPNQMCEGRAFHSQDAFMFPWEAGIIITFNQGCLPKIGSAEEDPEAFWKRVIVVPMRSRFEDVLLEECEPNTFLKDANISDNFDLWRSAFLCLLIQHWDPELLNRDKIGNIEWRQDLATENNPLSDWLRSNLVVTGDKRDCLLRDDVCDRYLDCNPDNTLPPRKIKEFVKNYLRIVASYKETGAKIKVGGVFKSHANVAIGVAMVDSIGVDGTLPDENVA
jgi:hypothetical protein